MNEYYNTKTRRVKFMKFKALIYGLILMLGITSSVLHGQETAGEIAAGADETMPQVYEAEDATVEIFGEEYNAKELKLLDKLSPEQLHQYLMQKEHLEYKRRNSIDWEGFILPPIIVGTVFFTPVLIVGCLMYFSYREKKLVHATIAKMVEKGMEIPPHLLLNQKKKKESSPNADLKKALILMSVGLGVSLFLFYLPDAREEGAWSIGIIPFLIGLGYLTFWKLDKPQREAPRASLPE